MKFFQFKKRLSVVERGIELDESGNYEEASRSSFYVSSLDPGMALNLFIAVLFWTSIFCTVLRYL